MVDGLEPDDDVAARLRALPREMAPPSHVAAALARHRSRRRSVNTVWRLAAAAALVVVAFIAGRLTAPAPVNPPTAAPQFAFLLYGGPTGGGDDRAAEYGAWARDVARSGRRVSGERLADQSAVAGTAMPGIAPLRGFFIVEAANAGDAIELARRHPHARDGTIIVRAIDTP